MESKVIFLIVAVFIVIIVLTAVVLNILSEKPADISSDLNIDPRTVSQPQGQTTVIERKVELTDQQVSDAVRRMEPYIRNVALEAAALKTEEASLSVSQQSSISARLESQTRSISTLTSRLTDMSRRLENFETQLTSLSGQLSKLSPADDEAAADSSFDPSLLNEINKNLSDLKKETEDLKALSERNAKRIEQLKGLIVHPRSTHFKWED